MAKEAKSKQDADKNGKDKKAKNLTIRQQIEGAAAKADKKDVKVSKKDDTKTAKAPKAKKTKPEEKTLSQAFWWGFLLPLRWIWKVLSIILWPLIWVLKHIIPVKYFVGSWKELRQVTWPTTKETLRLTAAVVIFAIFFTAIISVVDYGLDKLFRQLILN